MQTLTQPQTQHGYTLQSIDYRVHYLDQRDEEQTPDDGDDEPLGTGAVSRSRHHSTPPPSPCPSCVGAGVEAGTLVPAITSSQPPGSRPWMTTEHGLVDLDCLLSPPSSRPVRSRLGLFRAAGVELSCCLTSPWLGHAGWLASRRQQTPTSSPSRSQDACWRCPAAMRAQTALRTTQLLCSANHAGRRDHLPVGEECGPGGVVFQDPRLSHRVNSISAMCGAPSPLSTLRNPAASDGLRLSWPLASSWVRTAQSSDDCEKATLGTRSDGPVPVMTMFADRHVKVKVSSGGFSKRLVCRCTLSQGCPNHRIAQGRPRSANDPEKRMRMAGITRVLSHWPPRTRPRKRKGGCKLPPSEVAVEK